MKWDIPITLVVHTLCNRRVQCGQSGRLAVVLKLEHAAESPGGLVKTVLAPSSKFLTGRCGVGPETSDF